MKKLSIPFIALLLLANFACDEKAPIKEEKQLVVVEDDERMTWWRDAKFGMFIHWGAYSILIIGEAIYGVKASPYDRPEWGRYTSKPGVLYAHVFDWPEDGQLEVNPEIKIKRASLLANPSDQLEVETGLRVWNAKSAIGIDGSFCR